MPPQYLYHYTTAKTLGLILQNRTIRFNSLINMDDMEEAVTRDLNCVGKYLYISSWADDGDTENIALWGLYTNHFEGVRIKMITDPFIHYTAYLDYYEGHKVNTCFPPSQLEKDNLYLYPTMPFIRRVEYTSEEDKIIQSVDVRGFRNDNGTYNFSANLTSLGLYKRKEWAPQKEYRYQICVLPHNPDKTLLLDVGLNHERMPFEYVDLALSDEGYNSIEITLGPKMQPKDRDDVISLIHNFFPTDAEKRIHDSILKIK